MNQFADTNLGMGLIEGKPLNVLGLTLYPITMRHFDEWTDIRSALLCRMATFPAAYAVMPYISALHALEYDAIASNGENLGFMERVCRALCLSLQLPTEHMHQLVRFIVSKDDPRTLMEIVITTAEVTARIKPHQFNKIREAIALLNGESVPDEAEDPDLIRALNDRANIQGAQLNDNNHDLISSVAYKSHVRDKEVLDWTIREFAQRRKAIDRDKNHTICGIIEGYGAKWKGGNPCPSWCYDRDAGLLRGLTPIGEVLGKLGHSEEWLNAQMEKGEINNG